MGLLTCIWKIIWPVVFTVLGLNSMEQEVKIEDYRATVAVEP